MRKSLIYGIRDVQALHLRHKKIGDQVFIGFIDAFGPSVIEGTVLLVHKAECGWVVMVKNRHYRSSWKDAIPGIFTSQEVIPIWVSECGGCGVMDKTQTFRPMDPDYKAAKAVLDALQAQREREADACWAC